MAAPQWSDHLYFSMGTLTSVGYGDITPSNPLVGIWATLEAACGVRPDLPDWLGDLGGREERVTVLPADQGAVEKFILAASRAAREGAAA